VTVDILQPAEKEKEKGTVTQRSQRSEHGGHREREEGSAEAGAFPKWNGWSCQKRGGPPCFCVCTGMIGLTGEFRGCTGIVGLSMGKSEWRAKRRGVGDPKWYKSGVPSA